MIQVEDWSPSNGLLLEPNAEIAVRARQGCVALLAGPGAGKTETLAQRADFFAAHEHLFISEADIGDLIQEGC